MSNKKKTAEEMLELVLAKIDTATEDGAKKYQDVLQQLEIIKQVQGSQAGILSEHMRRTEANETIIQVLKKTQEEQVKFFTTEIEPLKKHVNMWSGAGKVLTILGTLAAMAGAIAKFFM